MNISTINKEAYYILYNENEILFKNGKSEFPFIKGSEILKLGSEITHLIYIGNLNDKDYYAASLNKNYYSDYYLQDFSEIYDKVDEPIFMLTIRGLHLVNWLKQNKYCSCCGDRVTIEGNDTFMKCKSCGYMIYPKITPAIIVAVLKGDQILLARSPHFRPKDMYSLIAGHVDPGEFIETCVRREVKEEVGIEIKNIKYFGSHPWPYKDKLMLGFIAEHSSGEIGIDNDEIEAADWFSLNDLPKIPEYKLSFSRRMIDSIIKQKR